jgi:hypothetical protein
MANHIPFELVNNPGDMTAQDQVVEIDTCVYAMETYPKGYMRNSPMPEMTDGAWRADWHPQGANRVRNWRDDTKASEADKPADQI